MQSSSVEVVKAMSRLLQFIHENEALKTGRPDDELTVQDPIPTSTVFTGIIFYMYRLKFRLDHQLIIIFSQHWIIRKRQLKSKIVIEITAFVDLSAEAITVAPVGIVCYMKPPQLALGATPRVPILPVRTKILGVIQ